MTLDPAVAPQRHKIKPMLNQATETQILNQVRRAITLNQIAGYHFCGNFLDLRFEDVRQGQALVSLRAGPHLRSPDGQIHANAFAVLADFAMASAIRTADDPSSRLATVSINLQCNGTQAFDYLNAHGELVGFHRQGKGRLGQSTVKIYSEKGLVASGLGSFMALPAPKDRKLFPIAWINQAAPSHPVLVPDCEFDQSELEILEHARDCLDWCASLGERADHYFLSTLSATA